MSAIVSLVVENVKRLSAVEIQPNGSPVVVIAGQNEAGKSSVLDAIEMVLGGKDRIQTQPVRRGQQKARIVADLGDIIVTRRFTADGGTSLVVTNREGAKYGSPQAILDGLVGKLTFDPLAFAQAAKSDPKQAAATLRILAGIDTADLDVERKRIFDERTLVNRDCTQAEGALAKLPPAHEGVGTDPKSVDDLQRRIADADKKAARAEAHDRAIQDAIRTRDRAIEKREDIAAQITELQARLAKLETDHEAAAMAATMAEEALSAKQAETAPIMPDREKLRAEFADIATYNEKVAANRRRAELAQSLAERKRAADALTQQLDRIDQAKADLLAHATFPVEGLGLDEAGVTWEGLPFTQASTAVKTRVSVAIGAALNPKLKVLLVRNGNDLDEQSLALLEAAAAERGLQIWLERIAGGGQTTVVIADGAVAAQEELVGQW